MTPTAYKAVKITGDSLVAANNPLTANNEVGVGRDITASVPGGFSSAGAVNGNLRTRAVSAFLEGVMGTRTDVAAVTGFAEYDDFEFSDALPFYTLEKRVGTTVRSANELLTVRYSDAMVNTFNITVPSAAFATFSAGIIACQEKYLSAPLLTGTTDPETKPYDKTTNPAGYNPASDDLLLFHGGQIMKGDSTDGATTPTYALDDTFQSFEVSINNNVMSDEYTVRPSRFLRSLTEGIRALDCNITQIFADYHQYQQYTYGTSGATSPGYHLYMGALQFSLANWQLAGSDLVTTLAPTGAPTNPQGLVITIPKLAFSGFPVTLTSGRIVVTTTAVALKPGTGPSISILGRPNDA